MNPSPRNRTFSLHYTSAGGPELAPSLHERETLLTIKGGENTVFLEQHRSESDEAGAPIGTFQMVAHPELLQKLIEYADREHLADLAPPTKGGPGTSVMTFRLEEGDRKISKTVTSGDIPLIGQLEYFLYQLNQIMMESRKFPHQAVRVTIAPDAPSRRFVINIENIGRATVCLVDPRSMGRQTPDRRVGIRFAELPQERPGITSPPLKWSELPIQAGKAPAGAASPIVTLKSGERLTLPTAEWTAAQNGVRYLVQGFWSDYSGPVHLEGCYSVRGAAFSENLKLVR